MSTYGSFTKTTTRSSDDAAARFLCFTISFCTALFFSLMFIIVCIAFDVACIAVGLHYENKPCYADHTVMPLNLWLIVFCSYGLIASACFLVQILCTLWSATSHHSDMCLLCESCGVLCTIVLYVIGLIILVIIGIIELDSQFESCKTDANIVRILAVIQLVWTLAGLMGIKCVFSNKKN